MRPIIALIRFIVYSNIFVAICAIALTHLSYLLLDLPKEKTSPILILVFCSTFFTYNIQRIVRLNYQELIGKNIGIRLSWVVRNRTTLLSVSLLVALGSVSTFFYLNKYSLISLIPLGALSILYVTPFIPVKGKIISLRQIPFAKIFIISLVWALVTVFLPYTNEYGFSRLTNINFILVLIARFIFIFAITLPFDIRDLRYDNKSKLKTIPALIGIKGTIIISELLLLTYLFIKFWQFYMLHQLSLAQLIALTCSITVSVIIIAFGVKKRPELYYSALVEATMIFLHFGI